MKRFRIRKGSQKKMSTFAIIAGLAISLVIILIVAFKLNEDGEEDNSEEIERDIESLGQNIDKEISNLEKEIEEFEL